jgi:porphobilinogen synthase
MELLFRPRRLRRREALRRMVRETHLRPEDFIYPMFAAPGSRVRQEVASMPGVARLSADLLVDEAKAALDAGVPRSCCSGCRRVKTAPAPRPPPQRARCSRPSSGSRNNCPNW